MLVLSRKLNERIVLNNNVLIEVLSIQNGRVRLGITAPGDVMIVREELLRPDVTVTLPKSAAEPIR